MHLAVDGYGADPQKLQDVELVRQFLDEYPISIGMNKIIPPQVYTYRGDHPEDWGISGFVLIAESHISIHTFPERGYMNIDIFSCKAFNVDQSLNDVKKAFSLSGVRVWTLERGLEHLSAKAAYEGMVMERVNIIPTLKTGEVQ